MNQQKIKELVLATGVVEYDWREDMKYNSSEELVERLIEVVVGECVQQIYQVKQIKAGRSATEYTQGFDHGMVIAIKTIKECFGVEL